jgi:predicted nucleotidyltransferase
MKDPQQKAVSYFLSKCRGLPIVSILTYGSFGRGDYKPSSDIDVLVVVDSSRYCKKDLISLMKILEDSKAKFHVGRDMDIILDSDIDLWNNGILSDGHHFSHLSTNYNKDAKVIFGEDIRRRFRLPSDLEEKARLNLKNIEAEYVTWILHYYHFHTKDDPYYESVPYYMTYCLLATFLNAHGIVEIRGFDEMCKYIDRFPSVAETSSFKKFRKAKGTELTDDEFMNLLRIIKTTTPERP